MKRLLSIIVSASLLTTFLNPTILDAEANGVSVPKPQPVVPTVKLIQPLPQPQIQPLAEIQPIPVPEPVQTASAPQIASNCVTGYSSGDYYLDKIIAYESGGNSCATNPGGCYGLLQACPGEPLREACGGDPACQIEWFQANKTDGRTWAEVWQHELDYGWW